MADEIVAPAAPVAAEPAPEPKKKRDLEQDDNWNASPGRYELDDQGRRTYLVTVDNYGRQAEFVVCPECDLPNPHAPCGLCNTMYHSSCLKHEDIMKLQDPQGLLEKATPDYREICSNCADEFAED
jgi:hypothetical protein